jgi:hypothetical protein
MLLDGMSAPNWKDLRHAYGSAEDLPDILAELEPDPKSPVWSELWGRVCHQGSTFSASVHVLPFLLSAASAWEPTSRAMPLALAGSIVWGLETVPEDYESSVEALRLLAMETLKASKITRIDRIYVMQSALAFQGDQLWGHELDRLNDGEFSGSCPTCHNDLYFVISQRGFFCAAEDWIRNPGTPRADVRPRPPAELAGVGRWLYSVCADAGDLELGEWICRLFGVSTCPQCGQPLDVAVAIAQPR